MTTIQEREYNLLKEYASQKLREEFDTAKNWWEQEKLIHQALDLGLIDLYNEMKQDFIVMVCDQRELSREFKESTGWPFKD